MLRTSIAGAWHDLARHRRATSAGPARLVTLTGRTAQPSLAGLFSETVAVLGARAGPLLACALVLAGADAAGGLAAAMDAPDATALSQTVCQFYRQSAPVSWAPGTIGFKLLGAACAWDALKLMVLIFRLVAGALVLPFACGTVAWVGLHGWKDPRITWSRAWRALAGRRRALVAGWLCCATLTAVATAGLGPLPHERAQATELAIDSRWPRSMFSGFSRGDVLRVALQRSLRGLTLATSLGSIEWLAALLPDQPAGLGEVCRNYLLNMAPLQTPDYDSYLGLDCAAMPAGETAPPELPVAILAILACALWPYSIAAMLSPGAARCFAGIRGRHCQRLMPMADRKPILRRLPVVLAHAGLLCLATLAATCLFTALPATLTPGVWAIILPHASWAAPIIEPLLAISSVVASSLLSVFGLVYAARLWQASGWNESRS